MSVVCREALSARKTRCHSKSSATVRFPGTVSDKNFQATKGTAGRQTWRLEYSVSPDYGASLEMVWIRFTRRGLRQLWEPSFVVAKLLWPKMDDRLVP